MSTLSVRDALAIALSDMEALSAVELRADLEKHRHGSFAVAMRAAREFLSQWNLSRGYHFIQTKFVFDSADEQYSNTKVRSPIAFECVVSAGNDNSYALAA
jgi:hypothetical protein